MLELRNITKDYPAGDSVVHALRGIHLTFRRSDFVSILGPSGCGKTTLLNIIGGLDHYTSGDLFINGRSTKDFKDRDWDTYRNHSVGFVFQSYNLIPHQTVLQNVELALTLSGVGKAERRARAIAALEEVGIGEQIHKRPAQMSGGQMQRVAIARALVNDPDIILADEPTGALDSETSVQVMDLLKKVAENRLVVMVTHNPDLADTYSTRIIRMVDGNITDDTRPLTEAELAAERANDVRLAEEAALAIAEKKKTKIKKRSSMSFGTAFMLSLKNLFTKKGRTLLTSFAGSIGIIGIALILAVSTGTNAYIDAVQEETLSSYPITLESQTVDLTAMFEGFAKAGSGVAHPNDAIYKDPTISDMVNALSKLERIDNDLASFKTYIEREIKKEDSPLKDAINGIQYTYDLNPLVYTKNPEGDIIKSDTAELMTEMIGDYMMKAGIGNSAEGGGASGSASTMDPSMMSTMMGLVMWQELLPGLENGDPINNMLEEQYDVIYGAWPNSKDEIVLVVNEKNELDDLTLYALGLISRSDIDKIIDAAASGQTLPDEHRKWSYQEICEMTFKVVFPYNCYTEVGDGLFVDVSSNPTMLKTLYEDAMELKVVGIIRPSEEATTTMLTGSIGYTNALTQHIIKEAEGSPVVKAQLANPNVDVLTGRPFESTTGVLTVEQKVEAFEKYLADLDTPKEKTEAFLSIQCLKAELNEERGLDVQVNQILDRMKDKNELVLSISNALAEQLGGTPDRFVAMLSGQTLEDLKELARPGIEEGVRAGIEQAVKAGYANFTEEQLAAMLDAEAVDYTAADKALYYDEITVFSESTYEENLVAIGCLDLDSPATINLYASSFENKDVIAAAITDYNKTVDDSQKIVYTDFLGIMMSSITTIINAITYVLIAFVAISLIVSSIMIGVITLISVQERTKEIGILRAIGASKGNVSSMFNAETIIIGFAAGLVGVVFTYLACIPINLILYALTDIASLRAFLSPWSAIILIAISVVLTLIAGVIPSRSAAKKDPVVALRTE